MAHVFVSHSKEDLPLATAVVTALVRKGHHEKGDVRKRPKGAEQWHDYLLQELVESDFAVFLITGNSARTDWISREAWAARALEKSSKKPRIIPVLFPGGEVPKLLEGFYYVSADRAETAAAEIDERIKEVMRPVESRDTRGGQGANDVFVVHGRNSAAVEALYAFLRGLGLHPVEWEEALFKTAGGAPTISQILESAFARVRAVLVLLTGDDEARLRNQFPRKDDPHWERVLIPQARQNVLFEAGMAFGRHSDRTILIQIPPIRPFTDIFGRYVIQFDGSEEAGSILRDRLVAAGCEIDREGSLPVATGITDAIKLHRDPSPPPSRGSWCQIVTNGNRRLTVNVARWPGEPEWFWVYARVTSTDELRYPLAGVVEYHLDKSYPEPDLDVPVIDGEALAIIYTESPYKLKVDCEESFVVDLGAIAGIPWKRRNRKLKEGRLAE